MVEANLGQPWDVIAAMPWTVFQRHALLAARTDIENVRRTARMLGAVAGG